MRPRLELTFLLIISSVGSSACAPWPEAEPRPMVSQGASDWVADFEAPRGAPNVVIWLMDDVGFGQPAAFGGLVETPTLDALAEGGLRFTNFHATPLCSPTRAALLTGRNPHAVGMGSHAALPAPYPGYSTRIPESAAGMGRLFRDAGYATWALGKWDQLPSEHTSPLGPFDYWPSGQGFERFYGFLTYDTGHFTPLLWRDHAPVAPPDIPDYHLTTDLADHAISWVRSQRSLRPEQPFLLFWSTGAVHAPHHAPDAWLEKYRGRFEMGWNEARERVLDQQKALDLVPIDTELPEWQEGVPRWETLSDDERRMAARAMEAFAAMLDHADAQFGRILDALEAEGILDDTLILVVSDNGASAEGGLAGAYNELRMGQGDWEENLAFYDDWGRHGTYPHYPVGWAAAGNTPFKYYKQSAFEGGHRVPMIVHWPAGIAARGEVRDQFHHVSDVLPTLLEVAGLEAPAEVGGVVQQRMDGTSFVYALEDGEAPTSKRVQYFEMWGNHGIWADGWKANVQLRPEPWKVEERPSLEGAPWELYHAELDFNERVDLAAERPEKLEEMQRLFDRVARENSVYPLMASDFRAVRARQLAWLRARGGRFDFGPATERLPPSVAPPINELSFEIEAELAIGDDSTSGTVFAFGGAEGGYALYLDAGHPVFVHNYLGARVDEVRSPAALGVGPHRVGLILKRTGQTEGVLSLTIDGAAVEGQALSNLGDEVPAHETFDVGVDWGGRVEERGEASDRMPRGVIHRLKIAVDVPDA